MKCRISKLQTPRLFWSTFTISLQEVRLHLLWLEMLVRGLVWNPWMWKKNEPVEEDPHQCTTPQVVTGNRRLMLTPNPRINLLLLQRVLQRVLQRLQLKSPKQGTQCHRNLPKKNQTWDEYSSCLSWCCPSCLESCQHSRDGRETSSSGWCRWCLKWG